MGKLKVLALGLGIALAGAVPAHADLIIKANGVTVASSANNDFTSFVGSVGSFNINVLSAIGVDSLPGTGILMDNGSLSVSSSGAGTLVITFIQTDLTSASATQSFFGEFSAVSLTNMTATRSFYADATNNGLATTLLGTTSGANASYSSAPVALSGLYSITEVVSITALGGGAALLSADDNIRIPEPLTLGLFGMALVALGLVRQRRTQPA